MAFPTSIEIWAYIADGWTELTSDVIKEVRVEWGMTGNEPLDLLADTGSMRFTLNNSGNEYAPYLDGALAGWGKGVPIELRISYDNVKHTRFNGVVKNIDIKPDITAKNRVVVTVADWLDYAATHPLVSPSIDTDKRGDEVLTTIVADMPIAPEDTDFDEGINVFPTVFDTVTTKTKAYNEMSKIALSELGYIYLTKDKAYGEMLVFESAEARHGLRELTILPKAGVDSGFLLKEDGGSLLLETGGKIILNEETTFVADNVFNRLDVEYGQNVINRFTNLAYPRKVDAAATTVLFSLAYPMQIGSGETIVFRGNYSDPDGGARVSGTEMVTPVADTDYKMWTVSDGSGVDITADLTILVVYGTEGPTFTLTNDNVTYIGWITLLQARGKGIYIYNPIEHAVDDIVSIDEFGYQTETLHQKYKQDLTRGSLATAKYLEQEKQPRTKLNKIHMAANRSGALMQAFLYLDVGDLIHVKEDKTGINDYYYIQGVEFTIIKGGFIKFAWIVKEALSLLLGLSLINCEFDAASEDCISYGYLPQISNLSERSFSLWIYAHTHAPGTVNAIAGIFSDPAGCFISLAINNRIGFYIKGTTGPSFWVTPEDSITLNSLTHIVIANASDIDGPPIIYIDAVAQELDQINEGEGTLADETGSSLFIGNVKTTTVDYAYPYDGLVKDLRIYNVILTQAEATSLEAGGNVNRGLVFQGPCVRTRELADFEDLTLTAADKMIENYLGMIGTPHGSVITRLIE